MNEKIKLGLLHNVINLLQGNGGLIEFMDFKSQIELIKFIKNNYYTKEIEEFYKRVSENQENGKIKEGLEDELKNKLDEYTNLDKLPKLNEDIINNTTRGKVNPKLTMALVDYGVL